MASIHVLHDDIINKIAAGEVIDRPASMVKELVENAIDAASDAITIELLEGGSKQVIVRDNGQGMSPEDAHLAIKRHATSKIATADDLFAISTMGFRGEALAAIASISKFTLTTYVASTQTGISLQWHAGELHVENPWYGPQAGTTITVDEVFYNIPVRAKFLKSPLAEYAQCYELVQAFALAHPEISFQLLHNGKIKLTTFAQKSPSSITGFAQAPVRDRISEVWGKELATKLLHVHEENQFGTLHAFISPPGLEKPSSKNMVFIVNGRYVKDKVLRYGLQRGYHSHLLKGSYPQILCFLTCDPALIDVNVHPAKTELRFQYPGEVQGLLARAIRQTLRQGQWASFAAESRGPASRAAEDETEVIPTEISFDPETLGLDVPSQHQQSHGARAPQMGWSARSTPLPTKTWEPTNPPPVAAPAAPAAAPVIAWDSLQALGSAFGCYLLFEGEDRILAVDQHAFHERILYERLSSDPSLLKAQQPLIIPEVLSLEAREIADLQHHHQELSSLGFEFTIADERFVELHAVPLVVAGKNLQRVLADLLSFDPTQITSVDHHRDIVHHCLSTLACHAAIRAGETLSPTDWRALLAEAGRVDFYHNCPHGRRVFKWFSRREVEAWFDRL